MNRTTFASAVVAATVLIGCGPSENAAPQSQAGQSGAGGVNAEQLPGGGGPGGGGGSMFTNVHYRDQGLTDDEFSRWLGELTPASIWQLDLSGNKLTAAAIDALGTVDFGHIHTLELGRNPLGEDGARAIARCARLFGVEILYLQEAGIGSAGVAAMYAAESKLERVRDLNLSGNPLGDEGVEAIARSPEASELRHLWLARVGLTDRGARALAESPHLGALEDLAVGGNELTEAGRDALRSSKSLDGCAFDFEDAK